MFSKIISIILIIIVFATNLAIAAKPLDDLKAPSLLSESLTKSLAIKSNSRIIAEKTYSLSDRYNNTFVNDVFSDNILLTLAYLRGQVKSGQDVNWNKVRGNFSYSFILKPGDTFAFHDAVLPQYKGEVALTTNLRFNSNEGFKDDGWLVGDGVCHLASFMNVVAKKANLLVNAPVRHDFAKIADVSRDDGVAIFYGSELQNLYITNKFSTPVMFVFTHSNKSLDIKVVKLV